MPKTPRIPIPYSVREYVYQRDNHQCKGCGKTQQETNLTVDHIIPLALGGSNDISNLQTLCSSCNSRKKHNLDPRFKRQFSDRSYLTNCLSWVKNYGGRKKIDDR